MAASSKVEACMFCGDLPCSCNGRRKPVRTKPAKADKLVQNAPSLEELKPKNLSFRDAMRKAAADAPPPPVYVKPGPIKHVTSDEDLVFNAAVRALAPLLHPDEQEQYAAIISSVETSEERKAVWKARRDERLDKQ